MSKHENATGLIWLSVCGEVFWIQARDLFIYSWYSWKQCVFSTVFKMTQRDRAKEQSKDIGFVQTNTWHKVNRTESSCAEVVDPLKYFRDKCLLNYTYRALKVSTSGGSSWSRNMMKFADFKMYVCIFTIHTTVQNYIHLF